MPTTDGCMHNNITDLTHVNVRQYTRFLHGFFVLHEHRSPHGCCACLQGQTPLPFLRLHVVVTHWQYTCSLKIVPTHNQQQLESSSAHCTWFGAHSVVSIDIAAMTRSLRACTCTLARMRLTYVVLRLLTSEDERSADRKFPSYVIEISWPCTFKLGCQSSIDISMTGKHVSLSLAGPLNRIYKIGLLRASCGRNLIWNRSCKISPFKLHTILNWVARAQMILVWQEKTLLWAWLEL